MAPPVVTKDYYAPNNFQFNGVTYPKDEYIREDIGNRVLSKFISENCVRNHNEKYFYDVYYFILNNIIPKHDELSSCSMLHEDVDGTPAIIFNIKFNKDMSFSKRNKLHYNILEEICDFCEFSKFSNIFEEMIILLVKGR